MRFDFQVKKYINPGTSLDKETEKCKQEKSSDKFIECLKRVLKTSAVKSWFNTFVLPFTNSISFQKSSKRKLHFRAKEMRKSKIAEILERKK